MYIFLHNTDPSTSARGHYRPFTHALAQCLHWGEKLALVLIGSGCRAGNEFPSSGEHVIGPPLIESGYLVGGTCGSIRNGHGYKKSLPLKWLVRRVSNPPTEGAEAVRARANTEFLDIQIEWINTS